MKYIETDQLPDIDFKVFGCKDTLLYASLCYGAVGGVCTAGNFMPELIADNYSKYMSGDIRGSPEARFKLNPVRRAMDPASFPVAAKDMANIRGPDMGAPYLPNLPTPESTAGLYQYHERSRAHRLTGGILWIIGDSETD